jgi:hypothetical protein
MQNNQRLNMEAQRLSQSERMANMEMQSRREISEQNQLREQQKMAIENAKNQSLVGLAKSRLEEQKFINDQKGREAALKFQREQAFAQDLANNVPPLEAIRRNPVSASVFNALTRGTTGEKPKYFSGDKPFFKVNPDGSVTKLYTPEKKTDKLLGAAGGAGDTAKKEEPGFFGKVGRAITGLVTPSGPAPSMTTPTPKRVRVKSPEGKVGSIPESQLDDALAAGYTEVK